MMSKQFVSKRFTYLDSFELLLVRMQRYCPFASPCAPLERCSTLTTLQLYSLIRFGLGLRFFFFFFFLNELSFISMYVRMHKFCAAKLMSAAVTVIARDATSYSSALSLFRILLPRATVSTAADFRSTLLKPPSGAALHLFLPAGRTDNTASPLRLLCAHAATAAADLNHIHLHAKAAACLNNGAGGFAGAVWRKITQQPLSGCIVLPPGQEVSEENVVGVGCSTTAVDTRSFPDSSGIADLFGGIKEVVVGATHTSTMAASVNALEAAGAAPWPIAPAVWLRAGATTTRLLPSRYSALVLHARAPLLDIRAHLHALGVASEPCGSRAGFEGMRMLALSPQRADGLDIRVCAAAQPWGAWPETARALSDDVDPELNPAQAPADRVPLACRSLVTREVAVQVRRRLAGL